MLRVRYIDGNIARKTTARATPPIIHKRNAGSLKGFLLFLFGKQSYLKVRKPAVDSDDRLSVIILIGIRTA